MKKSANLSLLVLLFAGSATACPPGTVPNAPAAAGSTNTSCRPASYQPQTPAWETRWGAFAFGSDGEVGVAAEKRSERSARRSAVADCKKRGGVECEAVFTYKNQCAAIATGKVKSTSQGAPTEDEAKALALQGCEEGGSHAGFITAAAVPLSGCDESFP